MLAELEMRDPEHHLRTAWHSGRGGILFADSNWLCAITGCYYRLSCCLLLHGVFRLVSTPSACAETRGVRVDPISDFLLPPVCGLLLLRAYP